MLRSPQRQEFRAVLKISKAEDQSLRATLHNVDRPSAPINSSAITLQGTNLKIVMASLNANYEGKFSPEGNTITGTWHSVAPVPLTLTRATAETAWAIPDPPAPPKAMAADANPSFEVATIKPSDPNRAGQSILVRQGRFTATNTTLRELVVFANGIHPQQISGASAWIETEKFDIVAQPDREGVPNGMQLRAMVQKLLAERFQLASHREKKDLPAYTIHIEKAGAKMSQTELGGTLPTFGVRGPGAITARNSTIAEFAGFLQAYIVDRPVVDKTGLAGHYNFSLTWRPEQLTPNAPATSTDLESRPDIFTAMREQLGLKFEAKRVQVDVIVIDRIEKPGEN